jgi:hypothetical protein
MGAGAGAASSRGSGRAGSTAGSGGDGTTSGAGAKRAGCGAVTVRAAAFVRHVPTRRTWKPPRRIAARRSERGSALRVFLERLIA